MANREALRIARELREAMRETGQEYTQTEYRDRLSVALRRMANDLYDEAVDRLAEKVDRDAIDPETLGQQQGELFDLDGDYRLGESKRVAKRYARLRHALTALEIDTANLAAVSEANRRKREELDMLTPFWGPDMTKAEAVDAWKAANESPGDAAAP